MACGNDAVVVTYGSRRFQYLLAKQDYEAILKDPFLLEHIDNSKLCQAFQAELDHILSEPLSDELMGLLPIIQQWGSQAQSERYAQQRDKYYLDKIAQMLAEPSSEDAIDDCIHHLKQLNETFPQSVSGHYELQALVSETASETWQKGKQHLVNAYGDQTNQQAYRLIWLKTLLFQPNLSQPCLDDFDYQKPYADWILAFGERQVPVVHSTIHQFLDHYDHSYPLGLKVIKAILSAEWLVHHDAQDLVKKLAAIEQVCERQTELIELDQVIQQQLTNGDYIAVASQFNFLFKQQTYCEENDLERCPHAQKAYQTALDALTSWINRAVFDASNTLPMIETIVLPALPEGETKLELIRLCQSAENSRFAYDRCYLRIQQLITDPTKEILPIEASLLDHLSHWPLEKCQELTAQIEIVLTRLTEDHPLRDKLSACQLLLLETSLDETTDRNLILQEIQPDLSIVPSESAQSQQNIVKQRCLALLDRIKEGILVDSNALTELIHYARLARELPELNSFVKALDNTLGQVLERALAFLATPNAWLQLPNTTLEQQGQQVIDDCELLRKLATPERIQFLDKSLDRRILEYCRLFVPLPSRTKLPQVQHLAAIYEQILSYCGNTVQQEQINAFSQMRTVQNLIELNKVCSSIVENDNANFKVKPNSTVQSTSFLSTISRTLQRMVTSSSTQQKLVITPEPISNNKVTFSSTETSSMR